MLQQHNRLKKFAAEFVQEIKICAQYSSAAHQNRRWQNLNVLIINAEKCQKRIKKSIKIIKWTSSDETMNQLMFEIRDHHVANETVKLIKKYFISFEKIMKRLQLTVLRRREKITRDIRAMIVYILNNFKRVHSKTYIDFSTSIRKNFRVVDLKIRNIRLIKNFQANAFFDENFFKNFSVTVNKIDIITIDTLISWTRAIIFKFVISKIAFIILRKILQSENVNHFNKSSIVSSAADFVLS